MIAKRIRMELLRTPVAGVVVPCTATINRILTRQGLVVPRPRKRPRDSFVRWERPAPMQLWGMDIVGGVMLVNPLTGVVREVCVMAKVVERASGVVSLGHVVLQLGGRIELFLTLALNTPTYCYAYHDATVDGLTLLTKLMGVADSGGLPKEPRRAFPRSVKLGPALWIRVIIESATFFDAYTVLVIAFAMPQLVKEWDLSPRPGRSHPVSRRP